MSNKRCKNRVRGCQQYCSKHAAMYRLNVPTECPICMEELTAQTRPTKCGHYIHTECLQLWLKLHDSCPVCRHQLKSVPYCCVQLQQLFDDFLQLIHSRAALFNT
jgi:hypothetical protein